MSSGLHAAIVARDPAAMSAAIYNDLVPVIPSATDPVTYDPRELGSSGGNVWQSVVWQGKVWERDDTSVAAADNITCIILADGGHYLTNDISFPGVVESRTVSAPPDSAGTDPSVVGKAWRVPTAATGTWSGHDDDVALGSSRGWQFHAPQVSDEHYVRAEKLYESYTEDNIWDDRSSSLGTGSVWPDNLGWDGRVQNQTTNSPPATWSKGTAFIIGPSPTGDWSSLAKKIAIAKADGILANGDTFFILTPFTGQQVHDISQGHRISWNGTAWVSASGAIIDRAYAELKTYTTISGSFLIPYDDSIPQSSEGFEILTAQLTPKASTNKIRVTLNLTVGANGSQQAIAALFRNLETSALCANSVLVTISGQVALPLIAEFLAGSTDSQTYRIRIGASTGSLYVNGNSTQRFFGGVNVASLLIEEIAA